jgi:hypothetical protein
VLAAADADGHYGRGSNGANGHGPEPAWLRKLKAGEFDD